MWQFKGSRAQFRKQRNRGSVWPEADLSIPNESDGSLSQFRVLPGIGDPRNWIGIQSHARSTKPTLSRLIIVLATEYCARCNDVSHSSPLYRQPFRKFRLRGTRLYLAARTFHRFRGTGFALHRPNPKPIWKIPQIGAASSGRATGIPDPLWIPTTNSTSISPLRRRVPRLSVNEPAFDLQRPLLSLQLNVDSMHGHFFRLLVKRLMTVFSFFFCFCGHPNDCKDDMV